MIEGAASKLELLLEKMMVRVDHLESQLAQKDPTPVVSTIPEKNDAVRTAKEKTLERPPPPADDESGSDDSSSEDEDEECITTPSGQQVPLFFEFYFHGSPVW